MPFSTIFFGTHNFAVTILTGLVKSPLFDVKLVVTQPDKPVGRKKIITPPPVKIFAQKHNIPVIQPSKLSAETFSENFDIGVTAQYGLLVPKSILNLPKHGIINVHTSLLPKYRGASPIQSAIINGDQKTGVTIMKMDVGLDTGPILLQKELPINNTDLYPDIDKKLATLSSETLLEALPKYISEEIQPIPQNNSLATHCKQFTREDGKINWNNTAVEIYNKYRGLFPWPGIWTTWNKKRLKLLKISPSLEKIQPGQIKIIEDQFLIGCKESSVEIHELQLEGKKAMSAKDFIKGYANIHGNILE